MHLILDIDHTLLNTSLLKKELARCCLDFGISKNVFWKTYHAVRTHSAFSVKGFVQSLVRTFHTDRRVLEKQYTNVIKNIDRYIYRDALFFLKWAHAQGHTIVLYTYGEPSLQREKIRALRKKGYIKKWIITTDRTKRKIFSHCLVTRKPWIWIDDFDSVPIHDQMFTGGILLQLRRKKDQKPLPSISSVKNLYQAIRFINRHSHVDT